MTAVMRAMQQAVGPKVLRIGIVAAGRIVEERIIKQRVSVTIGSSEKAMFVIQAPVPAQFKLFELSGGEYYLNFIDGMNGRIALPSGISELQGLKGQARRVGSGYQIRLTEDARGKVVVGETTILFQFVTPPPNQPRPRLPLSVKGGVANQIDWNLTVIAAFSFLVHFGFVGAMYSDWMDPVVNDDLSAGLLEMVQRATPPPAETIDVPSSTSTAASTAAAAAPASTSKSSGSKNSAAQAPDAKAVSSLIGELEKTNIAILAALGGGPNIAGVMKDDNGAPVDLNGLATRQGGIANASGGLHLGAGAGGPIEPGGKAGTLQNLQGGETGGASTSAGTAAKVVPVGTVDLGASSMSVPVSNAEAVIRRDIHPGAKRCYQKGLEADPTQSGKIVVLIKVAPNGEVDSASVASNSGLSAGVASCIASVARRAKFDPPGASGSTISVPFNFVKQGG